MLFLIPRLSQYLCFLNKVDIIFMWVSIYQSRCSSNQLRSKDLSFAAIEFNKSLEFNMLQLKMNPLQKEISELGNPTLSPGLIRRGTELGGFTIIFHFRLWTSRSTFRPGGKFQPSLSLSISQLRAPLRGWKSQPLLSFLGEGKIDAAWFEVISVL